MINVIHKRFKTQKNTKKKLRIFIVKLHNKETAIVNVLVNGLSNTFMHSHRILHIF